MATCTEQASLVAGRLWQGAWKFFNDDGTPGSIEVGDDVRLTIILGGTIQVGSDDSPGPSDSRLVITSEDPAEGTVDLVASDTALLTPPYKEAQWTLEVRLAGESDWANSKEIDRGTLTVYPAIE